MDLLGQVVMIIILPRQDSIADIYSFDHQTISVIFISLSLNIPDTLICQNIVLIDINTKKSKVTQVYILSYGRRIYTTRFMFIIQLLDIVWMGKIGLY